MRMTKEEFIKLSVKEQKSLVDEEIAARGWKLFNVTEYGDEWHQRFILVNTGGDEWRQWSLRTVTPLSLICGLDWPESEQ